jgi:MoCo/4Fe-4S cofactor protein with predicted Tat translocation signal
MSTTENDKKDSNNMLENSPKYWLTLDQWRQDPEFERLADQEFASSPLAEGETPTALAKNNSSDDGEHTGGWARREFLKLMGASMALGSFGCMRRPAQMIVPYVKRPKEVVEGLPNYYASSFVDGNEVFGVVVKTREGRPIHVTGNSSHPINGPGMSARAHAHVLALYDPARLTAPSKNLLNDKKTNRDTISVTYDVADKDIVAQIKKGKVAILTGSIVSPTLNDVVSEFTKSTGAKVYTWEALSAESYVDAQEHSYGQAVAPRLAIDKAKLIVSVNSDFLGTWLQPTQQMRDFSKGRKPGADMNRLVVFESLLTLTGSNADTRYRIRPSQSTAVIMGLLRELLVNKKVSNYAHDASALSIIGGYDAEIVSALPSEVYAKIADELWENRGKSLVIGSGDLGSQIAANFLNSVLGNDGITIDSRKSPNTGFNGKSRNLTALIDALNKGEVKTVIINNVNPVYATSSKLGFLEALRKADMAVYIGLSNDETGKYCDYVLPDNHAMEGWGDCEGQKGVYSVQQPTISPLYNSRSFGDTLISWAKVGSFGALAKADSMYALVRERIEKKMHGDWNTVLQEGVIDSSANARNSSDSGRAFRTAALQMAAHKATPRPELELVLYPSIGLRDGSMANVPWLQEFPDPITKICWDNTLVVSPKMAQDRKLGEGQIVKVAVGDRMVSVPVHIQPGIHDSTVGLALGYGRTDAGDVANGVGSNAFQLASNSDAGVQYAGLAVTLEPTKTFEELANVQIYHAMSGKTREGIDMGYRQIVVEATLDQYKENPAANIHREKITSAWNSFAYPGYKWGMAVDLNQCTGCSACVIACQSENNVPTIGKTYVIRGREMFWLRVDRYYVGTPDEPDAVHIPIMCQHCDNAPCETVCPVAATVHSPEGTNDMIYNRCVGTRYCSNNCPYKVRRFNWFNYPRMNPQYAASPMHMQLNPDVTVRSRGVMEKCSFCVQRIHAAKSTARVEDRKVRDGEIQTACQASCPTQAITFGDLNNPESKVAQMLKEPRYYGLLEDLNTRPAVQYASKIRNADKLKGERPVEKADKHSEKHQEGGHV